MIPVLVFIDVWVVSLSITVTVLAMAFREKEVSRIRLLSAVREVIKLNSPVTNDGENRNLRMEWIGLTGLLELL